MTLHSLKTLVLFVGLFSEGKAECHKQNCKKAFKACLRRNNSNKCSGPSFDEVCGNKNECKLLKENIFCEALNDGTTCARSENEIACNFLKEYLECNYCTDGCPLVQDTVSTIKKEATGILEKYSVAIKRVSKEEYERYKPEAVVEYDQELGDYIVKMKYSQADSSEIQSMGSSSFQVPSEFQTVEYIDITEINLQDIQQLHEEDVLGYNPDHLEVSGSITSENDNEVGIKNVYGDDTRWVFRDTRYPYSTVGRVVTSGGGICTGTMVGRNLMLTASHCMRWHNNGFSPVSFTPSYYDGHAPFGTAWATKAYYYLRVNAGGITDTESAYDATVVVLNENMGDKTGYTGFRKYDSSWNNLPRWQNIGYPGKLTGAQRPVYSIYGKVSTVEDHTLSGLPQAQLLGNRIDMETGHSGGPYWGWWGNEIFPRIIGVCSSHSMKPTETGTHGDNNMAGGDALIKLIRYARDNN